MFARFAVFILFVIIGLVALGALLATVVGSIDTQAAFIAVLLIVTVVGAIALLVRMFVVRTVLPIRGLISAAGEVADGDYSARAASTSSAVIQPVVQSFNDMAGQLEEADAHRRRLLADLGHELRTPLTVVRGEIEAMIDGVHAADAEHLELLLDEVTVMERLLADLRTLSLAESGTLALHPELTDLSGIVADVADTYRRAARQSGVTLETELDPSLEDWWVDPVRLREVVTNLMVNALNAMPDGGSVTLRTLRTEGGAVIEVSDSGHGITGGDFDVVFDRFHKGPSSSGSGLGLTISRDLVQAHGGTIDIVRSDASGTLVRVLLPSP
ncbi:MAG: sensor histidine kinase [Acidimicrobiia bacterium]